MTAQATAPCALPTQRMKLANDIFGAVLRDTQLVTMRRGDRAIEMGPLLVEPAEPGPRAPQPLVVKVCIVERHTLSETPISTLLMEGVTSVEELKDLLEPFYGRLPDDQSMTTVFWCHGSRTATPAEVAAAESGEIALV